MADRAATAAPAARAGHLSAGRLWSLAPWGVGLAALALGLIRLDARELWFDEKVTLATATRPAGGIWDAARDTEAPHLVYYLLMKPWLALAGTSDWAARIPPVVFFALAAAVLTLLGTRLFGRVTGLVAGLALASSSYAVSWSQQARGYTLAMLLAVLATYAFVRAVEEPSAGWWALWAAGVVAAAWVSLFAASVLAAHAAAFLALRPRPRVPRLALCAVAAGVVPIVVLVATANNGQLDWIPSPTPRRVAVGVWDWASRNPVALAVAALGAAALLRTAARWKAALVCAWVVAPFVLTLLLSAVQPAFESRYLLSAAPALALLVGAAVTALPRRVALAAAAVLAVAAGVRLAQLYVAPGESLRDLF